VARALLGPDDAEIIARTGWTRTAWLHAAVGLAAGCPAMGRRAVAGGGLAASLAKEGIAGLRPRWMRHALRWKPLLATAAAVTLGLWLPWQAAIWRPASLPRTGSAGIRAGKLLVLFVVAQLAWAVVFAVGRTPALATLRPGRTSTPWVPQIGHDSGGSPNSMCPQTGHR